ncbi:MAG: T9SS type A sorting domain-containing protein [Hydrotalea sp. AMD]|uniref:T9SS type A sorting domain-containing protein n=1 Tax=Hydrotalea sp. AMD TaxID=2501297 RepID=UPI000942346A|nr:T9SS type A sorting domain-containing protein [Hydrotalea sp. AMD]RWZ85748.1 MAG: T9SS type A sorting domain-containing protein [Hydrotalea sp. AMD]
MKKYYLLFIAYYFFVTGYSQTYDTTQYYGKMNNVFANINKIPITTGLLRDYGIDFLNLDNYTGTAFHDSNFTALDEWRMLYASLYSQQINNNGGLLYLDTINKLFNQYAPPSDPISFACLYYNYQSIDPNAINNNQIYVSNNQLFDVNGRNQSPYINNELFAIAPIRQAANIGNNQFIFRNNLFFGNTGKTISSIQVDPKGIGIYQMVNVGTAFTVYYDTAGFYNINIQITFTDNSKKYAHTKIVVYGNNPGYYAKNMNTIHNFKGYGPPYLHEAFTYGRHYPYYPIKFKSTKIYLGAAAEGDYIIDLSVNNTSGFIKKPLIVIEGFDTDGSFTYTGEYLRRIKFDINYGDLYYLNSITLDYGLDDINSYDLIFLHWQNGTDYIQRNAYLLEELINRINKQKSTNGITEKNVIIGMSMGGLVARYALRDMELNNINHDTHLFISHDAPHWGANVPVGAQAMVQHLAPWQIINAGGSFPFIRWVDLFPSVNDGLSILNSPAAKQMLIQNYSLIGETLTADNFLHNSFMNELNTMGWPLNCKNITLSNGSCNGAPVFPDNNSTIAQISGDHSMTYFGSLWRAELMSLFTSPIALRLINGYNGSSTFNAWAALWQFPLSLFATKSSIGIDFKVNAILVSGTSEIYRGDLYSKKKILGLINVTNYFIKAHVNSTADMLALDNAPGGTYNLTEYGFDKNKIQQSLPSFFSGYVQTVINQPNFCFVPTVSSLAFDNPTQYYRSSVCDIINCHIPTQVANYYAPQVNQFHISYTQENTNWILQNQDANYTCAKICPGNLNISGNLSNCNSEIYSLSGAPSPASITWSAYPNILSFSPTTGHSTTATKTGNGVVTLTASVSNSCTGIVYPISKQISVGTPTIQGWYNSPTNPVEPLKPYSRFQTDYNDACYLQYITTNMQVSPGATVVWDTPSLSSASIPWSQTGNNLRFYFTDINQWGIFPIYATNACGTNSLRYRFQSSNGCAGTLSLRNVQSGIAMDESLEKFAVFPNPAKNLLYVAIPADSIDRAHAQIHLMDFSGKTLQSIQKVNTLNTFNMNGFASGMYLIEITDKNKRIIKKIIKY